MKKGLKGAVVNLTCASFKITSLSSQKRTSAFQNYEHFASM